MARQPKGRDARRPLDPDWQFDAKWLRAAFAAAIPDYAPPDDAPLHELAAALNLWRSIYIGADAARLHNAKIDRAEAALAVLRETLPAIIGRVTERAAAGDPFSRMQKNPLDALLAAVARRPTLERDTLPDQASDWRWLLNNDALPATIERAIGQRLGNTKGGPLARLIERILPPLTGEARSAVAIGNQLRRADTLRRLKYPNDRPGDV
jgi:hypothetical protein